MHSHDNELMLCKIPDKFYNHCIKYLISTYHHLRYSLGHYIIEKLKIHDRDRCLDFW